ncbi:MAG: cobalamin-dependent protein [Planctomycetota bacterium]
MTDALTLQPNAGAFAATLLRSGGRAIASHATEALLSDHPAAGELFGKRAYRGWHDYLTQRVDELAAAVELGTDGLFARDITWSVAAFAARQVPTATIAYGLKALRDAIADDLPAKSFAVIEPILDAGIRAAGSEAIEVPRLSSVARHGGVALEFLELVLQGKRQDAIDHVLNAFNAGIPVGELYESVLLPVQSELGTMWHLGEVSVPEEHAATEAIRGSMSVLAHTARARSNPKRRPGAVLVGAVEGDRHDIGVRAVADLIEIAGHTAIYLGADVPTRDLVRACETFDTAAIVLSATLTIHAPVIAEAIRAIRDAGEYRVIVGGNAFGDDDTLAGRVGADAYAPTPTKAVEMLG